MNEAKHDSIRIGSASDFNITRAADGTYVLYAIIVPDGDILETAPYILAQLEEHVFGNLSDAYGININMLHARRLSYGHLARQDRLDQKTKRPPGR